MKPRALALGAAVVVAAVVALFIAMRSDDREIARVASPKITQADRGKPAAEVTRTPSVGATAPAGRPRSAVTDYMVGGVRVRDHRSGDRTASDVPPAIHPPEGRKIPSQLTSDIAQQVRAAMTECAINLPPDARGVDPRHDGTITISINDRQATITSASVQLRDVNASAAAPLERCIEEKSVGVATSAGEEADVAGYTITLAFRLR
jgi:hypothetical protein